MNLSTSLLGCLLCASIVTAGTLKTAVAETDSETGRGHHGGGGGGHHGGGGGGGGGGGHYGGGEGPGGGGPGWGLGLGGDMHGGPLHGGETFSGPTAVALALPIAVILIVALWVAAYNTLRSPPPKVGYNAGIVEQAGWGGATANVGGGYGYEGVAGTDQHAAVASNLAATTLIANSATQGAVATGRAFDELTHRVTRSIARKH